MLDDGLSYREIYDKSGVSTATVTRVARCVTLGSGGYRLALKRRSGDENKKNDAQLKKAIDILKGRLAALPGRVSR